MSDVIFITLAPSVQNAAKTVNHIAMAIKTKKVGIENEAKDSRNSPWNIISLCFCLKLFMLLYL